MPETLEKTETFSIEKLDATQLPELKGLKEKQLQIVKENPFVEICDTATFEAAKKARTTLVSARTEIQNQDKTIASKIKKFREMVAGISEELISITRPHEEKQQEEVKRWEAIKEAEKAEKQRLEDERIARIKGTIDTLYNVAIDKINQMTFGDIQSVNADFEENLYNADTEVFEEFELDFNEKLNFIKSQFAAKEKQLNELEAQRLEAEKIKAEREQLEADRKALEEKQAAENARIAKEQADAAAKLEADRKEIEEKQAAEQAKIAEARRELEAEKSRIAQQEADKKAAELKEALAIEKAEADRLKAEKADKEAKLQAERAAALKPEKEKAVDFLNCLVFKNEFPVITDDQILTVLNEFVDDIEDRRAELIEKINNL